MRILIIHSKYQQPGGEDSVVKNENELLTQFHDVDVLHFQNQQGVKGLIQFILSVWNVKASKTIKNRISDFKPDIIHVHNWHFGCGPIVFRTAKKLNIPIVYTLHNYRLLCPSAILMHNERLFLDSLNSNFPWAAVIKKVYRNSFILTFWLAFTIWIHKKFKTWENIDRFLCLTTFAQELYRSSSIAVKPLKFVVKPNFTPIAEEISIKRIPNTFLFVGRLSREKGLQILVDAVIDSDINLHIAGEGPMIKEIEEASQLHSNIKYIGKLNPDEVLREMSSADALIFPSIWFEGMPMTLIESFSVRTPIIASNLGAMSTMIKDGYNGLLFEPGDSNALRGTIEKWSSLNEKEKETMRENCHQDFMTNYTPESNLEQLLTIYSDLINEKK